MEDRIKSLHTQAALVALGIRGLRAAIPDDHPAWHQAGALLEIADSLEEELKVWPEK